jgi:hypothetical protein
VLPTLIRRALEVREGAPPFLGRPADGFATDNGELTRAFDLDADVSLCQFDLAINGQNILVNAGLGEADTSVTAFRPEVCGPESGLAAAWAKDADRPDRRVFETAVMGVMIAGRRLIR